MKPIKQIELCLDSADEPTPPKIQTPVLHHIKAKKGQIIDLALSLNDLDELPTRDNAKTEYLKITQDEKTILTSFKQNDSG